MRQLMARPDGGHHLLRAQCEAGVLLARGLRLPESICAGLGKVYERWDGGGDPAGIGGEAIDLPMRVVQVAHDAEVIHRLEASRCASARCAAARPREASTPPSPRPSAATPVTCLPLCHRGAVAGGSGCRAVAATRRQRAARRHGGGLRAVRRPQEPVPARPLGRGGGAGRQGRARVGQWPRPRRKPCHAPRISTTSGASAWSTRCGTSAANSTTSRRSGRACTRTTPSGC